MISHISKQCSATVLMAAMLMTITGCAGLGAQVDETAQNPARESDTTTSGSRSPWTRRGFGAAQAAQNFIQTLLWDPFFRPYSTASAVGSVALKTGGATVRRASYTVAMPLPRGPAPPLSYSESMDLGAWERELDRILGKRASTGNIRFLIDGDEYFPRLRASIAGAQTRAHVRTYIFDNDDVAVDIADMLRERSRDIEVRVLLDGVGTLLGTQVHPESLPTEFLPPLSMTRYLEDGSRVQVRTHSNPLMTGDHVKSTIIDGERAFVGGMNIGREYRHEWHDMMMEVTGEVVADIQRDADKAWAKAGILGDFGQFLQTIKPRKKKSTSEGYSVRVLYTLPHDSQIYRAQLAAIRRAKSYIFIENAYFSDDIILHELVRARLRGVDVRVIIPTEGNHPMMNLSNGVAINTMIEHDIRVYRYPGMSHVKAAVFDGWACVGSANFDAMSLRINREMNLATSDPSTVGDLLVRVFYRDFAASTEISRPTRVDWRHSLAEIIADAAL